MKRFSVQLNIYEKISRKEEKFFPKKLYITTF